MMESMHQQNMKMSISSIIHLMMT